MLAILADDLTGALDSAAPFAGRGLRTEVALAGDMIADIVAGCPDVISINLNTREISADAAREATAAAMALLPASVHLFKKVDSRLKGNIVAELDAIPFSGALVAPAIPEFGRIVESGRVSGFGVDLPIVIADKLGSHAACATIPDTRTCADMDAILDAAQTDGIDILVGARGLAEALARRMTGARDAQPAKIQPGSAIFVIGSRDPITLAQIDALRAYHDFEYLAAPNGVLSGKLKADAGLTLVQATPGEKEVNPALVSEALAESLKDGLTGYEGTLLLSGGATAQALMRALGVSRLTLHGECLPGLGLASSKGRCIIAKSGGFGAPETLKTIAEMIRGRAI